MTKKKILVADDDRALRGAMREYLLSLNFDVLEAGSCHATRETFKDSSPDAAILDYRFPDGTSLDLLPFLRQTYPGIPIILLTGNGTIPLAVQAMKEGAEQFLTKPVELAAVAVVLERALQNQRNRKKQLAGRNRDEREAIDPFVGTSQAITQLAGEAQKVAASDLPVLLAGETGSGKGVLARWLHNHSERADEAFVDLNCAGFGRELLESELFGHEMGAFTGATQRKLGLFEVAQSGTIFLDEIGDMDLPVQPKLLKVLEEKRFRRLGDVTERQLDVRVISGSHHDLSKLIQASKFRSDLYFRVSTVVLTVPPLRKRVEDIPLLVRQFFERVISDLGRPNLTISDSAIGVLTQHSWPGNIRELKNVIERAVLLASGDTIGAKDLRIEYRDSRSADDGDSRLTLREIQRLHIEKALKEEGGNIARAAERLGMTRGTLYSKINTFGLHRSSRQDE